MTTCTILVVEDDVDGQEVMGKVLRYHGMIACIVGSGEEALAVLNHQHYTAAIIDLSLPGMDGWSLLGRIRNNDTTQNLPCFAMTAFHSAELAVDMLESGFDAYFPKPIETGYFVREIQRLIGAV